MKDTDLKNYVCSVPFTSLEVHSNTAFLCCPSWLPTKLEINDTPLKEIWNSEKFNEVRDSILDGSFSHCSKKMCPHLSRVVNFDAPNGPIFLKKKINLPEDSEGPENVIFNFDRSCNYKCPSCRKDFIVANTDEIGKIKKTIDNIENNFSHNIRTIGLSGSADPFASASFRDYLRNFDPKKYKKLGCIHLHTNASLWNEEMWNSMPNVHKYVKSCEISIDAGTKDTYENKTRIGGNWDNLIKNLKFIRNIESLKTIKTSFVVQKNNYKEMNIFADLMTEILGDKARVFFGKITNWGTFTDEEFNMHNVCNKEHPEFDSFLTEFNLMWRKPNVFHNMYELIDESKKTLI